MPYSKGDYTFSAQYYYQLQQAYSVVSYSGGILYSKLLTKLKGYETGKLDMCQLFSLSFWCHKLKVIYASSVFSGMN